MTVQIIHADVLDGLRQLPSNSVHCVVTSPPYWGLRDYGTGTWEGGDAECEHRVGNQVQDNKAPGAITTGVRPGVDASRCIVCGARRVDNQLGLESTLAEHIDKLVEVFEEVRRVLRPDGVLFLNYGDVYAGSWGAQGRSNGDNRSPVSANQIAAAPSDQRRTGSLARTPGLKPKDNCLIPERLAIALQEAGWWVRDRIIWHKPNPMPSSVTDRCTPAHEPVYMLTKSARYWYDAEAIKEKTDEPTRRAASFRDGGVYTNHRLDNYNGDKSKDTHGDGEPGIGRNCRNVWTIPTHAMPEAHFATFPPKLVERCLLAACPERVCSECGAGWVREVERAKADPSPIGISDKASGTPRNDGDRWNENNGSGFMPITTKTLGWSPSCTCPIYHPQPAGTVLDPFGGSGTVGLVADRMNRHAILIELSANYCEMARARIANEAGLFADVHVDDGYDAADDARRSYEVAIEALREEHERKGG